MALCGIEVLWRSTGLRRPGRQKMAEIVKEWTVLESQWTEVERVFSTLVGMRHYAIGLTARHECVRAEYIKVGARIAEHRPLGSFASLSEAPAGGGDEILTRVERPADAGATIMIARDFFTFAPGWRDAWKTEVGPTIEDLDILDDAADTLESVNTDPRILMEIKAFGDCVGDDKDSMNKLGMCLESGQITPVQALEELDRITNEARTRIAGFIKEALATDALTRGRHHYARWKGADIRLTAANAEYDAAYWSQDADTNIEYNPAATIQLTANSAGIDLGGLSTSVTSVPTATGSSIYLLPVCLDQYLSNGVGEAGDGSVST